MIEIVRFPLGKGRAECDRLAHAGWEPFSVTSGDGGKNGDTPAMFFRKKETANR